MLIIFSMAVGYNYINSLRVHYNAYLAQFPGKGTLIDPNLIAQKWWKIPLKPARSEICHSFPNIKLIFYTLLILSSLILPIHFFTCNLCFSIICWFRRARLRKAIWQYESDEKLFWNQSYISKFRHSFLDIKCIYFIMLLHCFLSLPMDFLP